VANAPSGRRVPPHLHLRTLPGGDYSARELGAVHETTAGDVLAALQLPTRGEIYDLDCGRWPGMPVYPAHPPFLLTSYRSPRGMANRCDEGVGIFRDEVNAARVGLNTELVISTVHTGTHLDALNHITCGLEAEWHGGYREAEDWSDFGTLRAEASSIAPFVCRGVLVDVPAALGVDLLEARHLITRAEIERTLSAQGTQLRRGDAVLIRTGYMQVWDTPRAEAHHGAGIDHASAAWLADSGAVLVGADTEGLERIPSPDPANPHPVHVELLVRRGVHIMELAYLEGLASDGVREFLFVCLPLRIRGATGSMVRPLAIA